MTIFLYFFFYFLKRKVLADNSHEMSNLVFSKKIKKKRIKKNCRLLQILFGALRVKTLFRPKLFCKEFFVGSSYHFRFYFFLVQIGPSSQLFFFFFFFLQLPQRVCILMIAQIQKFTFLNPCHAE